MPIAGMMPGASLAPSSQTTSDFKYDAAMLGPVVCVGQHATPRRSQQQRKKTLI